MRKRLKKWLIERFFPAEAKLEIESLRQQLAEKEAEIERLEAYIDGLETGLRAQRRMVIHNEVKK